MANYNDVRRMSQERGVAGAPSAIKQRADPSYHQMQNELDVAAGYQQRQRDALHGGGTQLWNAKYRPVQDSD